MIENRSIGVSDLLVRPIGLGCMPLSLKGRFPDGYGINVLCAALDAGMNFLDTADVYCIDHTDVGHNERLIAKALREWKGNSTSIVVATKGGLERPGGAWIANAGPDHLETACEASLKALEVETITLYYLHAPDPEIPLTESVGALARLREKGKIQHIGLSNVSVADIKLASSIVPIVSVQNRCNPFDREAWQQGVISHCEQNGIAFIAYSPVGGGNGKVRSEQHPALCQIGKRYDVTPFQIALAWLLRKSSNLIAIPGANRMKSAVDSAAAMDIILTDQDMAELDHAFPLNL
ncbi:MAG: aldo/keto reductase [Deltaproteobacteria bacterium]|nr:aldo/keto reductase [Deltaproteobacteria bacterium]